MAIDSDKQGRKRKMEFRTKRYVNMRELHLRLTKARR